MNDLTSDVEQQQFQQQQFQQQQFQQQQFQQQPFQQQTFQQQNETSGYVTPEDYYRMSIEEKFSGTPVTKYGSLQELAHGFNNLVSVLGRKFDDASPEVRDALAVAIGDKAVGMPENKDGYCEIKTRVADMINDDGTKTNIADIWKDELYERGIGTKHAQAVIDIVDDSLEGYEEKRALEVDKINEQDVKISFDFFGDEVYPLACACDKYIAKCSMQDYGLHPQEFIDHAKAKGYLCDPIFLTLLNELAGLKTGERYSRRGEIMSQQSAVEGDNTHSSDLEKILSNPRDPNYKAAVMKVIDRYNRKRS